MKIDFFLEKKTSRTGQLILCDNSLDIFFSEQSLWGYDLYIERLSVPSICSCMSKGSLQKNMYKHHIFPICDALAQKVLITRKLVFSLT